MSFDQDAAAERMFGATASPPATSVGRTVVTDSAEQPAAGDAALAQKFFSDPQKAATIHGTCLNSARVSSSVSQSFSLSVSISFTTAGVTISARLSSGYILTVATSSVRNGSMISPALFQPITCPPSSSF